MKISLRNLIFANFSLLLLVLSSCGSTSSTAEAKNATPIDGVWELSHFYNLGNGDTLITDTSKVQHKIYMDGHVIWNTNPAPDGSEWHGYGRYTFKNDTITETLTSMSKSMQSDVNTYIIPIERSTNSYKQVNTYSRNDTVFQNIEVYKKLN
ncbi:hypothetical protein [Zobellia alginiliquefaciens]|uniref:hypothetical protein n=1 Tax=Zobellia alginiliquefaciens TaxID=3032586 RepID=UPI0023E43960|nr:hypothetical protein [Zobellia alginiliquefaciens]